MFKFSGPGGEGNAPVYRLIEGSMCVAAHNAYAKMCNNGTGCVHKDAVSRPAFAEGFDADVGRTHYPYYAISGWQTRVWAHAV